MTWFFGLLLSLVPFALGLVFVWRRIAEPGAVVILPWDVEIRGSSGFVIFVLGLLFLVLCLSKLGVSEPTTTASPLAEVQKVGGFQPLGGVLRGQARLPRLDGWLSGFARDARVVVHVADDVDLQRGDYLAALRDDAPDEIPHDLGNLDSDTTALLRVSHAVPSAAKATLDGFAATEAAAEALKELPDPVSGARAMTIAAPVRQRQRVLVIGRDEKNARDRLQHELQDAHASRTRAKRRLHLRQVVNLADDFAFDHPRGFFAAEVLNMKGDALDRLGDRDAAIAAFRRFLERFPGNPKVKGARERLDKLQPAPGSLSAQTFVAYRARATSTGVVPASAIAARASSTLPSQGRVDYEVANLVDGDLGTAWSEGSRGTGNDVTIRFRFDREFDLTGLRLVNGYAESQILYDAHTRPRSLRIETDRGVRTVRLRDTRDSQFPGFPVGRTRSVRITVKGVYPAPVKNTMLTEFEFLT